MLDYFALALTTFGVGYIPGAPGTYGSAVAVGIYLVIGSLSPVHWTPEAWLGYVLGPPAFVVNTVYLIVAISLGAFCLLGIWAASRSISLLGNEDPSEAVVDEVMGQWITLLFIPFLPLRLGLPFIVLGFLLFRLFDIWKPFPCRDLEMLPGGLGVCADDIVAGVYAGICLLTAYTAFAIYMSI